MCMCVSILTYSLSPYRSNMLTFFLTNKGISWPNIGILDHSRLFLVIVGYSTLFYFSLLHRKNHMQG